MRGQITMSIKEAERVSVIEQIINGKKKQKHGARDLGISTRQIRRLVRRYKAEGIQGLVHKSRGKSSNHKIDKKLTKKIIQTVSKKYYDFGPTLASEKLQENEGLKISKEKLRQLMIQEELWTPKTKKIKALHQMRNRRAREGELIQIDGSPHAWFENRAASCCLLVYIDDATGKLKKLHFCEKETTNDYFVTTKAYIKKYGLPIAFYSDKHSIFKINIKELNSKAIEETTGLTQFGRAMKELKIELINANTPQAKGRVERANQTLQDRLVKELRLAGINTIKEANKFAPKFIKKYNKKFAVIPKSLENAHRKLDKDIDLDMILSKQFTCTISKNLTVQYDNKIYQIQTKRPAYTMRKQKATIIEKNTGEIDIIYQGNTLEYELFEKQPKANVVLSSKELDAFLDDLLKQPTKKKTKPSADHPWRRNYKAKKMELQTC